MSFIMFELLKLQKLDIIKYDHLCNNSQSCPVFYQINFLNCFNDIIKDKLVIAIIHEGKEIQCAIPGIINGKTFEALTYFGFDSLDIIVNRGYTVDAMKSKMIDCILKKYDVIKLSNFISIDGALSLFYYKKISSYKSPIVYLPNNFVEYIQSLNKSFQKKIRWEMNYAEKMGVEVTFVNTSDSKQSPKLNLDKFFQLHNKRIAAKGIKSSFLLQENKLFHEKLVNNYKAKVLFTEAWYQGDCIGTLYGFIYKAKYYYFNSGIDTTLPKIGIGTLLLAHTMKYLISNGIFIFDFLRGSEKYKYHWTKCDQENYTYYIGSNNYKSLICWIKYLSDQRKRFGLRGLVLRSLQRENHK